MGKLKFTLSNLWLWSSLIGTAILTENLQYFSSDMKGGLNFASVFVLLGIAIVSLFMFYLLNHKENKIKFDYVLMPIFILAAVLMVVAIWVQDQSAVQSIGGVDVNISLTTMDKTKATIGALLFLLFMYGLFFMNSRIQPNSKAAIIPIYVCIAFVYVTIIYSLIVERKEYQSIFSPDAATNPINIASFFGNKNYYGGILFTGILSCMLINYHRPRFVWYMSIAFFLLILLSTASVLPALIATIAVPIYLIEEIVRYSVKKKWYISISATVTVLAILALILVFFWGVKKEWKGFNGIDLYITEIIAKKDFKTLTSRTVVWEKILPACFDSPMHMLLGHGFMISTNIVEGITFDLFGEGVRSTHNGYLQVLFEFGLIGLVIHAILVLYFVYALIRLLLEKRFHFVFVYGFVALAFAAYNVGESSPLFTYKIKEIYMTAVLAMPVITRCKLLSRKHIVKEAMDLPVEPGQLDPIKLGKSITVVLVSLMVSIVPLFLVQFTYDNRIIATIFGKVELYLFICLLFVPYIISLYYRNTNKLHFVLHCAFNGVAIGLIIFIIYYPLGIMGQYKFADIIVPIILFFLLLIEAVAYSFIKRGSIRDWARIFAVGTFLNSIAGYLSSIILGCGIILVIQNLNGINWFTYLFSIWLNLCIYYAFLYLIPVFKTRELIYEVNKISLYHVKRCTIKDETTYG